MWLHLQVQHASVVSADLCMYELILFLILLAIPLELLGYLCLLVCCQQCVRPGPPAELQKPLPLGPTSFTVTVKQAITHCMQLRSMSHMLHAHIA